MKKFKMIFNKYDLKDSLKNFVIKQGQPFGAAQIYKWTAELVNIIKFDKRFLYSVP